MACMCLCNYEIISVNFSGSLRAFHYLVRQVEKLDGGRELGTLRNASAILERRKTVSARLLSLQDTRTTHARRSENAAMQMLTIGKL